MYANLPSLKEQDDPNVLSSLLLAPLELQYTAPALMNNFRSPLVLYGTESLSKRLMGSSGGPSKRMNLEKAYGALRRPKQKNEP